MSKRGGGGNDFPGGMRPPAMSNNSVFGGAPASMFGGAPSPVPAPAPSSPLSKLVQQGYPPTGDERGSDLGVGGCPPPLPGSRGTAGGGLGGQDSFGANVAQQWTSDVKSTQAQHQQKHDPNYCERYKKPSGYRVNQAPGGGSSINLSWGGSDSGGDPGVGGGHLGRGQRAPSPSSYGRPGPGGQREASPFAVAGRAAGGQREASPFAGGARGGQRDSSPFAGGGRAPSPSASRARASCPFAQGDPEPRGAGGRPPVPMPRGDSRDHGAIGGGGAASAMYGGGGPAYGGGGGPAYGGGGGGAPMGGGPAYGGGGAPMGGGPAFQGVGGGSPMGGQAYGGQGMGGRADPQGRSSNSYASGANQNCGNYMTDRRTTRVALPPGGRSQICFG